MRYAEHDYLHDLYDSLNDSPKQRHFRALRPMPFGVVFLPWKGMTEEDMRQEFRRMKELGFTNLKQTMPTPDWSTEKILRTALEEGIQPFWYGEGGWEPITEELLQNLGIPTNSSIQEIRTHPKMVEYQNVVIGKRISYEAIKTENIEGMDLEYAGFVTRDSGTLVLGADPELREEAIPIFKAWVKAQYDDIEKLVEAWNQHEVGITMEPYTSWEDFESDTCLERHPLREYRFVRDILRFKADYNLARIRKRAKLHRERDPDEPIRAGGEMGLFLPFVWRGTDMEGIAAEMRDAGSFYPSIHFSWHYEEVNYEVARCIYMQSSLAADWFKGGWSATWESTGGPQQLTGGKGWNPKAANEVAGFTVDSGTMTQLLLSYLASGFKGAGIWTWNYRRAGWEAGEFALLNRQGEPSERAVRAGSIAKAANRLRDELWEAHKEPDVGVFVNWDNEAIWAAISVRGRDLYKHIPVHSRVGISRSLINGNIPWEYVTAEDIRRSLAPRYRTIFLPSQISISNEILERLLEFARQGGRVVLDAPGGWYDENGRILETGKGTVFERLFGTKVADFQYSNNVPRLLNGKRLKGFIMDLNPTTSVPLSFYQTGEIAVTEHRIGDGSALILGYEASKAAFGPENDRMEGIIRAHVKDAWEPGYSCADAIVYRISAPAADHYFFMNDDEAKSVHLSTDGYSYSSAEDPVSGEPIDSNGTISLEAYSGRWIRCLKAT